MPLHILLQPHPIPELLYDYSLLCIMFSSSVNLIVFVLQTCHSLVLLYIYNTLLWCIGIYQPCCSVGNIDPQLNEVTQFAWVPNLLIYCSNNKYYSFLCTGDENACMSIVKWIECKWLSIQFLCRPIPCFWYCSTGHYHSHPAGVNVRMKCKGWVGVQQFRGGIGLMMCSGIFFVSLLQRVCISHP